MDVAFGVRPPRMISNPPAWKPRNAGLDPSQVTDKNVALQTMPRVDFEFWLSCSMLVGPP